MRYYKLQFKDIIINKDNYIGGDQTPAPNIQFTLNSYTDNTASLGYFIRIFNPPNDFFINARKLIGTELKLFAGFSNSTFTQKLGYTQNNIGLLFRGKIKGVVSDYASFNPSANIVLQPLDLWFDIFSDLEKEKFLKLDYNDLIADKIKEFINSITQEVAVEIDTSAQKDRFNQKQTLLLQGKSLQDFNKQLNHYFDFHLQIASGNILIYKGEKPEKTLTELTLKPNDLLDQPQIVSANGIMNLSLILNPKIKLNHKIKFSSNDFVSPNYGALSGYGENVDLTNRSPNGYVIGSEPYLFNKGGYQVIAINHLGDYCNSDINSWATNITCVPLSDKAS